MCPARQMPPVFLLKLSRTLSVLISGSSSTVSVSVGAANLLWEGGNAWPLSRIT
jgi:hypothetical protein